MAHWQQCKPCFPWCCGLEHCLAAAANSGGAVVHHRTDSPVQLLVVVIRNDELTHDTRPVGDALTQACYESFFAEQHRAAGTVFAQGSAMVLGHCTAA